MTADLSKLSRRERQIMHIIYRLGRATAAQVRAEMSDAPSNSAVRAQLGSLERKGVLTHEVEGPRYVYAPTLAPQDASRSALSRVVGSFFQGSSAKAAVALLEMSELDEDELDALEQMIQRAREEGR